MHSMHANQDNLCALIGLYDLENNKMHVIYLCVNAACTTSLHIYYVL